MAIEGRDAERAERIVREEVSNAAAEAMRLLSENGDPDSLQSAGTESAAGFYNFTAWLLIGAILSHFVRPAEAS